MWSNALRAFQWETKLPQFCHVRQAFPRPRVEDLPAAVNQAMDSMDGATKFGANKQVAITAGSRGISQIPQILEAVVRRVRYYGGCPFLVPAMGSHGAANVEGQLALLAGLGITEETIGAPINASMEVVQLGELPDGMPLFMDRFAANADAIIVMNRIKPHPDFSGDFESGLAKMTTIGLGKERGADAIHRRGVVGLQELMPQAARLIVQKSPIANGMGLAIIENAYDEIARVVPVEPSGIAGPKEAMLLAEARALMPHLPYDQIDVLIIDEIGKNISGAGIDTKIIGRIKVHGTKEPEFPAIKVVVALDVTAASHGNAIGLGLADIVSQRMVSKMDFEPVYINALTAGITGIQKAFLPIVAPNDRAAIMAAVRVCGRPDTENVRIVRIRNTLILDELDVSETLLGSESTTSKIDWVGPPFDLQFDVNGQLPPLEKMNDSIGQSPQ